MLIASLPMYDFPELREDTDALWAAIGEHARAEGIDGAPYTLTRPEGALDEHWLDPNLLLSHTCGYPVVRVLTESQHVLGSFDVVAGDTGRPGWYRTVIVGRADDPRADCGPAGFAGARAVANDHGSLSGYVSLGVALAEAEARPALLCFSGAHSVSIELVRDGHADIASVDAHSFALFAAHRPEAVRGLRVIGRGPMVAVTPLFTAHETYVDALRRAVAAAVASLAPTHRERLQLRGFVPHGRDEHEPVRDLAARACAVLDTVERVPSPSAIHT